MDATQSTRPMEKRRLTDALDLEAKRRKNPHARALESSVAVRKPLSPADSVVSAGSTTSVTSSASPPNAGTPSPEDEYVSRLAKLFEKLMRSAPSVGIDPQDPSTPGHVIANIHAAWQIERAKHPERSYLEDRKAFRKMVNDLPAEKRQALAADRRAVWKIRVGPRDDRVSEPGPPSDYD